MADLTAEQVADDAATKKKSKLPLIIGLAGMLLFGGGSFYALYSGMILAPDPVEQTVDTAAEKTPEALADIAFVKLDPMVVSLEASNARHLRFSAELEVPTAYQADVELLRPRVMDVLNGYLRAVSLEQLENRSALIRLRAQMLRRIQMVTGEGRVNDLLIIEFVLN